jgi:hypothetical protein
LRRRLHFHLHHRRRFDIGLICMLHLMLPPRTKREKYVLVYLIIINNAIYMSRVI